MIRDRIRSAGSRCYPPLGHSGHAQKQARSGLPAAWPWTAVTFAAVALPVLAAGAMVGPSMDQLLLILGVAAGLSRLQGRAASHLLPLTVAVFALAIFAASSGAIAFAVGVLLGVSAALLQERQRRRAARELWARWYPAI